jgi:hypothetical protein
VWSIAYNTELVKGSAEELVGPDQAGE